MGKESYSLTWLHKYTSFIKNGQKPNVTYVLNWTRITVFQKKCLFILLTFGIFLMIHSSNWTCLFASMRLEEGNPCKIHKLDPWDKSLKEYLQEPPPIICSKHVSLMYVDQIGYLQLNHSATRLYNLTALSCVYHIIHRVDGDKKINMDKTGLPFEPPIFIPGRLFRIVCKNSGTQIIYDYVHVNIMWNESQSRENHIGKETDEQLSIIFLGIDSASRSHALRKLPKSYKYLTEQLNAYDFKGYMKVGLNSFPNMFPLLTGENSADHPLATYLREYLDNQPFLWYEKAMARYSTLWSEDRPHISTFIFNKGGFKKSPVDYYYRPYSLALDEIPPVIVDPLGKSTLHCYGNEDHYNLQIEYFKTFVKKYTTRLKFGFLWNNQMGHESFLSLGHADKPLFELLRWLKTNDHLKRSILIVGSDHGFRMGGPSTTYIGRLENNMPFLTIHIPDFLKSRYPWLHENLQYNTDKLISSYDLYETMKDVVFKKFLQIKSPIRNGDINRRSLFGRIPKQRTCKDAGIPVQFCSCYDNKVANTSLPVVKMLALYTVNYINQILFNRTNLCSKLTLKNISEARVIYIAKGDNSPGLFDWLFGSKRDDSGRYQLMLYTRPNNGLIEVMIDYKTISNNDSKIMIIGNPIRANKYGNQSHCVSNNTLLREYCFCSDQL